MLQGNYKKFYTEIVNTISKKFIHTDKIHTLTYGTDASFYRLIPKIVINAQNPSQVQRILELASKLKLLLLELQELPSLVKPFQILF